MMTQVRCSTCTLNYENKDRFARENISISERDAQAQHTHTHTHTRAPASPELQPSKSRLKPSTNYLSAPKESRKNNMPPQQTEGQKPRL